MLSKKIVSQTQGTAERLETPRSLGYRQGMTSSGVIARRLENIYDLPSETPQRFNELLQTLDRGGAEAADAKG